MTKSQKVFCIFLCLCFFAVLAMLPEPFSLWKIMQNVYRQFPFYCFVEEKAQETWLELDEETVAKIGEENGKYLGAQVKKIEEEENKEINKSKDKENQENQEKQENQVMPGETTMDTKTEQNAASGQNKDVQPASSLTQASVALPHPILDLSQDRLADYDYLISNFYIVDDNTDASAVKINAAEFLAEDFSLSHGPLQPQILIYHSHSQETFADSREGEEADSIVGVGSYLTSLLTEKYGYRVIHIKEAFDLMGGELDRSKAYDYACDYVEKVLEENPSVEVVIDLHRDGIDENRHLVTKINGKDTAQILFYNGLSYTNTQGAVSYLPNPYIQDNLAFSFQLEYQAALYYPTLYRGIYLAGLRYNLHLRKRALLLEAGAQTNTVQEVKNAMEPFADILDRVLKGSDKQN